MFCCFLNHLPYLSLPGLVFLPPAFPSMEFEVPMYVCSGLTIKYLRVFERGRDYVPFRWVRYITHRYGGSKCQQQGRKMNDIPVANLFFVSFLAFFLFSFSSFLFFFFLLAYFQIT